MIMGNINIKQKKHPYDNVPCVKYVVYKCLGVINTWDVQGVCTIQHPCTVYI